MAYRYPYRGKFIEVDSPEELAKVAQLDAAGLLGPQDSSEVSPPPAAPEATLPIPEATVPEAARYDKFTKRLYGPQRSLAEFVVSKGEAIMTLEEFAKHLGVDGTRKAGGIVSAIRRNAKLVGLESDQVLCRLRDGRYVAGPLLLQHGLPLKSHYERLLEGDELFKDEP